MTNQKDCITQVSVPSQKHRPENRSFQGIPGLAVTRKNRVFTLCYSGGKNEGPNNFVVLWYSDDNGRSWSNPAAVVDPDDPEVRAYDSTPWIAPDGSLWLFWTQTRAAHGDGDIFDGRAGVWFSRLDNPDDNPKNFRWSHSRRICDGIMMNKPVVLKDGTWALPVSVWGTKPDITDADNTGTKMIVSEDNGKTFSERGKFRIPKDICTFDEHSFVEQKDGSIRCIARVKTGNYEAYSYDGGRTWTNGGISPVSGPCSRLFIRRLASGKILLVNNISNEKYRGLRENMTAWLSEDDGKTWLGGLLLDGRINVSYPDGQQADDGSIWIVHDWNRYGGCEIVVSHIREEDILAGKLICSDSEPGIIAAKSNPV